MCGIVGYTGCRPAESILLKGLQRLEYRGYDSAGLATLSHGTYLFLLPGCALFGLLRRRALPGGRWIAAAGAAFVLAVSPLIAFNLASGFYSFN